MSNITKSLAFAILATTLSCFSISNAGAQNEGGLASVTKSASSSSQKNVIELNERPRFPGCEGVKNLLEKESCAEGRLEKFITDNLRYPEISKNQDYRPRIIKVEITVEADGRIHSPRILEPGIRDYDVSAQEVFVKMTQNNIKWVPGIFEEQAVRSVASATVHFTWEGRNKAFPTTPYGEDVFELVDEVPAFASCMIAGRKDEQIRDCASEYMDNFFAANMIYPADALKVGLEGEILVEFIVGKDGQIRNVQLKNDIGLGCGEEARRLLELMNEKTIGWLPGEEDGQKVNVVLRKTVRFRIDANQKPKTKLALMDAKPMFITERPGFEEFQDGYLKYPQGEEVNPCAVGVIDAEFKVNQQSGDVTIVNLTDFNNLGKEFKASVTNFLTSTNSEWNVEYPNLSDETKYFLSIPFVPNSATCPQVTKGYKEMIYKALDGAALAEKKANFNDGLELLDKAVRMYPADNKIRYLRGMVLYKNGRQVEGCVDLSFVSKENKEIEVPKSCK